MIEFNDPNWTRKVINRRNQALAMRGDPDMTPTESIDLLRTRIRQGSIYTIEPYFGDSDES